MLAVIRLLIGALWLISLVIAYQFGRDSGSSLAPAKPRSLPAENSRLSVDQWVAPERSEDPQIITVDLLLTMDPERLAARVYDEGVSGALMAAAMTLAETGSVHRAVAVIEAYAALDTDAEVRFVLSDLQMMQAAIMAALEPLFEILDYPETPEIANRAQQRIDMIVSAHEQQLSNGGDTEALIALYEWLVARAPAYDRYRFKLAQWLFAAGDLTQAAGILQQTGAVGVSDAEREALEAEIAAAAQQLPIEREGNGYYATVAVRASQYTGEQTLRLLVDTGATTTSLAESVLQNLGAQRLPRRVRVATAGGVTEMATYRLAQLTLGGRSFDDLVVLALPRAPGSVAGLLGMDVLDGLPKAVGTP